MGISRKYERLETPDHRLFRIRALRDFSDVKAGDIGGFVEGEYNLSHDGDCWIYDDACAWGNGRVLDNAKLRDRAQVSGDALVFENAVVAEDAEVFEETQIKNNALVREHAQIAGKSIIEYESDYCIIPWENQPLTVTKTHGVSGCKSMSALEALNMGKSIIPYLGGIPLERFTLFTDQATAFLLQAHSVGTLEELLVKLSAEMDLL